MTDTSIPLTIWHVGQITGTMAISQDLQDASGPARGDRDHWRAQLPARHRESHAQSVWTVRNPARRQLPRRAFEALETSL